MNDKYLWEKSGRDPETMGLEEALAIFRYRESAPPTLPAWREATPRGRFVLAFAAPAFAVLTLAAGAWFGIVSSRNADEVTFIHHPAVEVTEPTPGLNDLVPITSPPAAPRQPSRRTQRDVRPTTAFVPPRFRAKEHSAKTTTVAALTKEERHAYEQLMLALAISGSKIKIVHDAIKGVEVAENIKTPNNR